MVCKTAYALCYSTTRLFDNRIREASATARVQVVLQPSGDILIAPSMSLFPSAHRAPHRLVLQIRPLSRYMDNSENPIHPPFDDADADNSENPPRAPFDDVDADIVFVGNVSADETVPVD